MRHASSHRAPPVLTIFAALVVLAVTVSRGGERRTALKGVDDTASGALKGVQMLAQVKRDAVSGQIKATQHTMNAFDAKFDEAFNKGWKDAGRTARQVDFANLEVQHTQCFNRNQ